MACPNAGLPQLDEQCLKDMQLFGVTAEELVNRVGNTAYDNFDSEMIDGWGQSDQHGESNQNDDDSEEEGSPQSRIGEQDDSDDHGDDEQDNETDEEQDRGLVKIARLLDLHESAMTSSDHTRSYPRGLGQVQQLERPSVKRSRSDNSLIIPSKRRKPYTNVEEENTQLKLKLAEYVAAVESHGPLTELQQQASRAMEMANDLQERADENDRLILERPVEIDATEISDQLEALGLRHKRGQDVIADIEARLETLEEQQALSERTIMETIVRVDQLVEVVNSILRINSRN
ncbi:hypothetical protein G7Z17_g189 [Cylindrodendrum hubeiense]|uniref:Uncharacterized protein n=1 Tax=Cylindrodendrum hubeiense TaxID=595255 RepID=A0A9P5HM27_9HYPO|nr:hypothetical protein G7Z17_g189 [Cylindrodendrum hubeiense]